jgi:hypothetical protein
MSSSEDVVFGDEGTTAVPPFARGVYLQEGLERDGMGRGFAASDDPRDRLVEGFDGLFVQVAEVQLGCLKKTVGGFKRK